MPTPDVDQLARLASVMHALRRGCPWDADQTHASLVPFLIEESAEAVEAIEAGSDEHLREELGDLLLQVYFHAEIASERGAFTLSDVARGICDKLVARHPYVFTDAATPDDLVGEWERRKRAEKGRTSSLDGIPAHLEPLAKAQKMFGRARSHGVHLDAPQTSIDAEALGAELIGLVARAQASGLDADAALRAAVRSLAAEIEAAERAAGS